MTPKPLYVICDKDGKPTVRNIFLTRARANKIKYVGEVVVKYLPEGKKT